MINDSRVRVLTIVLAGVFLVAQRAAGSDVLESRDLQLVGDAHMVGDFVQLTPLADYRAGACWYTGQVDVQGGFVSEFRLAITEAGGFHNPIDDTDGADGLAFVIQNQAVGTIGIDGYGMGYEGIPNSIAIEFDTWRNNGISPPELHEPDGYHISVHTRGVLPNNADETYSRGCVPYPALVTVAEHLVKITYEPGSLEIFIDDLTSPILTIGIDVAQVIDLNEGRAWLGFTAGTGAAWEYHDILDWSIGEIPVATANVTWGEVKALYR